MKFTIVDALDDKKKYHFLRTLNTEKKFKDKFDVEFNAQLGAILAKLSAVEKSGSAEAYADIVSLQFNKVRDSLVDAMFAKVNEEGGLYQNSETAEECQKLIDNGHIKPNDVLARLLKSI